MSAEKVSCEESISTESTGGSTILVWQDPRLKCNRQRPCQNCIARAAPDSCSYVVQTSNGVSAKVHPTGTQEVYNRVNRLENLVLSLIPKQSILDDVLITNGNNTKTLIPGRNDQTIQVSEEATRTLRIPESGDVSFVLDGRQYIGESHWDGVLRDIASVKKYLDFDRRIQEQLPPMVESVTPALLAGVPSPMKSSDLLSSLPSKVEADQLVTHFFQTYTPELPSVLMLHKPTFIKQYDNYWNDISKAPTIWLGLLYSVLCLAMQSYVRDGVEPPQFHGITARTSDAFRTRAAQCILVSGISIPSPYSIESFMLYGLCEYSRLSNGNVGFWMLWGLVVRKAIHMGYHKDPKSSPSISPFDGEIRRRVWMCVSQMDLLLSFQLGLPTMIRTEVCDAETPRYLHEEELSEDMQELPSSRSPSDPTQICYLITKHHILQVFAKVIQYLHDSSEHSYDRVLELNDELIQARFKIPLHLQLQDERQAGFASRSIMLERMQLQMSYHKAICVLNRRYLSMTIPKILRSRLLCLQSAMSLLSIQITMHKSGVGWYHFSLTSHDFLLAAVIVCLVLHNSRESKTLLDCTSGEIDGYTTAELLSALVISRKIWEDVLESSSDARRAARVLGIMLEKFRTPPSRTMAEESQSHISEAGTTPLTSFVQATTSQGDNEVTEPKTIPTVFDWNTWDSIVQCAEFDNLDGLWNAQKE
ncbi:hypothetical protein MMC26_005553 [Xylographa opegraphella]|nr:hypothetical protein [Xylographa opegraphella]